MVGISNDEYVVVDGNVISRKIKEERKMLISFQINSQILEGYMHSI